MNPILKLSSVAAVLVALHALDAGAATTLRVTAPASTPATDTVFVAGSFQGWNPGDPNHALVQQQDGRWTITLDLPDGQPIQFKFTRGTWARVEKGPNGEEIPDRTLTPSGNETYDLTVARWADQGTITGRVEMFSTPAFLGGRTCRVYLPPGYEDPTRRFPVLYMHDGQNLFDVRTSFSGEWRVDEACESLILGGEILPLIVVGIDNSDARCFEYTPWPDPVGVICGGGGGGDVYLRAIRDQLIPAIDVAYRTLPGPANTWMGGSSLGGLISAYAGYTFPETWGRIAAVSPSYWWAARMMLTYATLTGKPDLETFYQDMGTGEPATSVQNLRDMRDIMVSQGFVLGDDLFSVEADGHTHAEFYWAQRFPDILRRIANPVAVADIPAPEAAGVGFALRLGQNPVMGVARIEMTLERATSLQVEVLDLNGRRVRTIQSGALPAGHQALTWDGRDLTGTRVPPGLYWVRASDGARAVTRSLVMLR